MFVTRAPMASTTFIAILYLSVSLCCVNCELNLTEGSACTDEGFNGTCVSVYRCPTAAASFTYLKAGYTENIAPLPKICSNEEETPIVCCTDCDIQKDDMLKNYAINVRGAYTWKNGPKARDKCLDYLQKLPYWCHGNAAGEGYRIKKEVDEAGMCHKVVITGWLAVGGRAAKRREFPHMALLGYGEDLDSAQWLCGGTVISERFILTAGHCVYSAALGPVEFAALGILKRSDPTKYWKVHKIKRIIKHPEYKPPCKYNDIALLETETEIAFTPDLLPACLDTVNRIVMDKTVADATGWGQLGHRSDLADTLQVVSLREFDESSCSLKYPTHRHMKRGYDHATQMCFGAHDDSIVDTCQVSLDEYNETGCSIIYQPYRLLKQGYDHGTQMCYGSKTEVIDTCESDSGGPLQTNQMKCLYTLVGVTSYGKDCGLGNAGMYTRVSHYVPWIESIVWP